MSSLAKGIRFFGTYFIRQNDGKWKQIQSKRRAFSRQLGARCIETNGSGSKAHPKSNVEVLRVSNG